MISPNFAPLPLSLRSIDRFGWTTFVDDPSQTFFTRYKKNSARDESIVREAVYLSDVTRIEREYVWESVLGDFIVKEFITEGFGDGAQC